MSEVEELEKKKKILKAIREAIANIRLEEDFKDFLQKEELTKEVEEKIKKLGAIYEDLGRLCS